MRISGRDFMDWYDAWSPTGLYWESDVVRVMELGHDPLHYEDGSWRLDPDVDYDVDDLGRIEAEGRGVEVPDTYRTIARWIERRGLRTVVVRVDRARAAGFGREIKPMGATVSKAAKVAGMVRGVDFMDWYEGEENPGFYFEENGEPLHDDAGGWRIDLEEHYDVQELGALVPEDGDLKRPAPDAARLIDKWVRSRSRVPLVVLVPEASVDAVVRLGVSPAQGTAVASASPGQFR